jgi:hypothetical protein
MSKKGLGLLKNLIKATFRATELFKTRAGTSNVLKSAGIAEDFRDRTFRALDFL